MRMLQWVPVSLTLLAIACGGSSDDSTEEDSSDPLAICSGYRSEFCEYSVECGLLDGTAAECVEFLGSTPCRTDRLATDCRTALTDASCAEPPENCSALDVLDRSDSVAACDDFSDRLCLADESCGGVYDTCRATIYSALPCELVLKLDRDPAPCLASLESLACTEDVGPDCEALFQFL